MIREGRCIACGAKIEVVDGVRSQCDCRPKRGPMSQSEKRFASWFDETAKNTPRPDLHSKRK